MFPEKWYFKTSSFWHFNSRQQKHQCLCFQYWDYLTNFWRHNWWSIIDVVERLAYKSWIGAKNSNLIAARFWSLYANTLEIKRPADCFACRPCAFSVSMLLQKGLEIRPVRNPKLTQFLQIFFDLAAGLPEPILAGIEKTFSFKLSWITT